MPRPEIPAWTVRADEPCYALLEDERPFPPARGRRRVQAVTVVRDDHLVTARADLGPAAAFTAPAFICPGGVTDEATGRITILHTVGELRDLADHHRHAPQPEFVPDDLAGQYHDLVDRRRLARRRVSVFGPRGYHQRSN